MFRKIKKLFKPSWKTLRKKVMIRQEERELTKVQIETFCKFLSFGAKVIVLAVDHFSNEQENKKPD